MHEVSDWVQARNIYYTYLHRDGVCTYTKYSGVFGECEIMNAASGLTQFIISLHPWSRTMTSNYSLDYLTSHFLSHSCISSFLSTSPLTLSSLPFIPSFSSHSLSILSFFSLPLSSIPPSPLTLFYSLISLSLSYSVHVCTHHLSSL